MLTIFLLIRVHHSQQNQRINLNIKFLYIAIKCKKINIFDFSIVSIFLLIIFSANCTYVYEMQLLVLRFTCVFADYNIRFTVLVSAICLINLGLRYNYLPIQKCFPAFSFKVIKHILSNIQASLGLDAIRLFRSYFTSFIIA